MRNRFYSKVRQRARETEYREMPREIAHTASEQEVRLAYVEMRAGFAQLTAADRQLLILATVEELPYDVIAAQFKVRIGTIKSRVSRAREKLKQFAGLPQAGTVSIRAQNDADAPVGAVHRPVPARPVGEQPVVAAPKPASSPGPSHKVRVVGGMRFVPAETLIIAQATPHQRIVRVFRIT